MFSSVYFLDLLSFLLHFNFLFQNFAEKQQRWWGRVMTVGVLPQSGPAPRWRLPSRSPPVRLRCARSSPALTCMCVFVFVSGTMAKPAGSLARSSSLCRSRRSIVPASPQCPRAQLPPHAPHQAHARQPQHPQHPQHSLPSPDPDILSVSSCPVLYRNEEEEEAIYFSAEKQWYCSASMTVDAGLRGGEAWGGWEGCWVSFPLLHSELPQTEWLRAASVY